jgi:hypothetical protein
VKAQGHLVRADLAGGIRGLGLERVVLVDGDVSGRAVNLGGGGADHALLRLRLRLRFLSLALALSLANIERAFDVEWVIGHG